MAKKSVKKAGRKKLRQDFILQDSSRKKICDFIRENAGISITGLEEKTGINRGTLKHHLKILLRAKLILSERDKNKKGQPIGFFTTTNQVEEKKLTSVNEERTNIIQNENKEEVIRLLRFLKQNPDITRRKLHSIKPELAKLADNLERQGFLDIKYPLKERGFEVLENLI